MNIPIDYSQEVFYSEPFGNNAFDFELRSQTNPQPTLRIAPLKNFPDLKSALQEWKIARYPAFEIVEEDQVRSFAGLENFLLFPNPYNHQNKVFVFDNHNHAFYFWALELKGQPSLPLVHIDQHKDSRIPAEMISTEDISDFKKVYQYTNNILNVGNFIPPAIKTGLVSKFILVDSESSLKNFQTPIGPFILDIDLDFFDPALDYIGNDQKIDLIKKLLPNAAITTIASSPYFIDQELAFQYLKKIFDLHINT